MSGIVDKDTGASALLARVRELAGERVVRVGILDDAPKDVAAGEEPSDLSLLEVAILHEFGAPPHLPMRSFIRATVDERRAEIGELQAKLAVQVLGMKITPEQALSLLGMKVAAMVQAKIASNIPPALAPSTIKEKGSSVALIRTGQLRSSVTWKVEG